MEELIKEFRIAISNILLYPPESALIKKSIAHCISTLENTLGEKNSVTTVSESEGILLADGKPIEVSGGIFLDSLIALKIKSIVFKAGVTQEELYTFLRELASKHIPKDLPHIEISEKFYVPVGKKDLIIEVPPSQDFRFAPTGNEGREKVLQTTNDLSTLIDLIKDNDERNKIKIEIARKLFPDDPNILALLTHQGKKTSVKEKAIDYSGIQLTDNIKELLNVDDNSLLEENVLQKVAVLFESARSPEELVLAEELCDKLANNLEASVTDIRLKATIAFKKLYSTIEALRDKNIVRKVDLKLVAAGEKETDAQNYQEIANLLGQAATRYLKEGNYADMRTITEMFSAHSKSDEFNARKLYAKATMDKLGGNEYIRLLIDELSSDEEEKREEAKEVLMSIGPHCVPLLIAKIKETADFRLRRTIADMLVKIGDTAVHQLIHALKEETDMQAGMRILDIIDGVGQVERVVDTLRRELANPHFHLRQKTVELLCHLGTESAKETLLLAIHDESHIIKEKAIEGLGNMKYTPATKELIQIIDKPSKAETVQKEVCRALGNIEDKVAIPILLKVANPRTMFYQARPRQVRIAAIEALIKLGEKRVQKFVSDKDPLVSKTVKELLKEHESK
ncbi:MAG: HEAT repeat domain-containing protein [Candidatus Stahlbacteria bacterium]|nr:HEAT repeat domain-containing protein [Candidatus Stahlbacteria bacterium]